MSPCCIALACSAVKRHRGAEEAARGTVRRCVNDIVVPKKPRGGHAGGGGSGAPKSRRGERRPRQRRGAELDREENQRRRALIGSA